jgi:hypothetical protein
MRQRWFENSDIESKFSRRMTQKRHRLTTPFKLCSSVAIRSLRCSGFTALHRAVHPNYPRPGWARVTSQTGNVRRNAAKSSAYIYSSNNIYDRRTP